jgi:mRNA-degrading endonuclease YafQ of YafQ-DinJ toxin-antitoxin module
LSKKNKPRAAQTYSLVDVLMASPSNPTPQSLRTHQLTSMYEGLRSLERDVDPKPDDWRALADVVNLMETLVLQGLVDDESGVLADTSKSMAEAAIRYAQGKALRLDGQGIASMRGTLEDYTEVLDVLSHRQMVVCHRATELRIREIQVGKTRLHDIVVVSI